MCRQSVQSAEVHRLGRLVGLKLHGSVAGSVTHTHMISNSHPVNSWNFHSNISLVGI